MIHKTYEEFFRAAMGSAASGAPYPYQRRFATDTELHQLIRVPTGAGKTAAVILGWLWRLHFAASDVRQMTPRRLVYCLPMRVLVEQSVRETRKWIANLQLEVPVKILMGGVEGDEWFLQPERPTILIGTQDMLLSRALNRGYAASRFHWPIDFGLLNNDCLWVFDEPQLMGAGVPTSAQLAGLRAAIGTFGPCPSLWLSATLEPQWLATIDFAGRLSDETLELSSDDYDPARPLFTRMTAQKTLKPLGVTASNDGKEVAEKVVKHHRGGTQTLVVLNTVERAKAVFAAIKKQTKAPGDVLLVHSRFRPAEREPLNDRLSLPAADRIIIATQVVEAGVDISARTLITDLAPWASIVQRIGRCNRTGDDGPGRVFWIDLDVEKNAPPYEPVDLKFAREQLTELDGSDVSPRSLDEFKRKHSITLPFPLTQVLRRRDLIALFDTTPDLSGSDIDVARYVRGDDPETDVQVFWRSVGSDRPTEDEPSPNRRELCNVPIGAMRAFLKRGSERVGYTWDHLENEWRPIRAPERELRPGIAILLSSAAGGYSDLGWDADSTAPVEPVRIHLRQPAEGTGDDPISCGPALTIANHTQHVCDELAGLLQSVCELPEAWRGRLNKAARWHDCGKGHAAFQHGLHEANPALDDAALWAKSGTRGRLRHGRKYFRHELASALAALQHGLLFEVAYLIASHHGKIRLSIRTMPGEDPPSDSIALFAQGIYHGDVLPEVDLGGESCPALKLDLSPMQLGGDGSWTARALKLLADLGPFKLAYLEALLRAADVRASQEEAKNV